MTELGRLRWSTPSARPAVRAAVAASLRADPGKVAAIRSGLLAERERAGWRLRNDTTSDQVGWTIADSRGFHVGFNVFPSGEATVGGSGPCLPASAGTPSPSTWPDAR